MSKFPLESHPIHLGLGATATVEPEFTGVPEWYEAYASRHAADGVEGRLLSMHTFSESWGHWEMHPEGSEVVLCTAGTVTLLQEAADGSITETVLASGDYAVNEPGVWHTADADGETTLVFVTAGMGTQHRPR